MKVDFVLILAAGKGTRMGEIGKYLPKVIWPLFEKTIIESEIEYAKYLSPTSKIYTNLYNNKEKIKKVLATNTDIAIIEETEEIDIGGAIHNFANIVNYSGNLLVINSDQFLFFDQQILHVGLNKLNNNDCVLFSFDVNSSDHYNALKVSNNKLEAIISNIKLEREKLIETYSGISLIKLESLDKSSGKSKFFDTVANPKKKSVSIVNLKDNEYWDFGTKERYFKSIFKLLESRDSKFKNFLIEKRIIDKNKINLESYNAETGVNFSSRYIKGCQDAIILSEVEDSSLLDLRTINWKNLQEKI